MIYMIATSTIKGTDKNSKAIKQKQILIKKEKNIGHSQDRILRDCKKFTETICSTTPSNLK